MLPIFILQVYIHEVKVLPESQLFIFTKSRGTDEIKQF